MSFPSTDYSTWIRFRDINIYKFIDNVYNDVSPSPIPEKDKEDYKSFIEGIWSNVLKINNGLNSNDLNYLLFTHLLILNSEFILPEVYKYYGIENRLASPLSYISSTSDGSTSVSSTILGEDSIGLDGSMYMLTKWGYLYLSLLQQLQSMVVIL